MPVFWRAVSGELFQANQGAECERGSWREVDVLELNVRADHVHIIRSLPPKLSVSEFVGLLKGKLAIKLYR